MQRPFREKKHSALGNPFSVEVSFHVSAEIPYTEFALSGTMDSNHLGGLQATNSPKSVYLELAARLLFKKMYRNPL